MISDCIISKSLACSPSNPPAIAQEPHKFISTILAFHSPLWNKWRSTIMAFHFLQIHLNHSSFPSPHSEIDKSSRPHLGGGSAVGIDKSAPWSKPTNFWPQLSWQHFRLSSQPWAKFQEMARERRLSSEKWNFLNCRLQLFSENFTTDFDRVRCCSLFFFVVQETTNFEPPPSDI